MLAPPPLLLWLAALASSYIFVHTGTEICAAKSDIERDRQVLVKGFATIDHVALINVEGTGMVGVHGTASAIFTTVRDVGVNVIMISQASSEHSVCFAVNQADGEKAIQALGKRYACPTPPFPPSSPSTSATPPPSLC